MRKIVGVFFAMSLVLPTGVGISSPAGAAGGTKCRSAKGTAIFTPKLPRFASKTKVSTKLTFTETVAGCGGGGVTSGTVSLSGAGALNCTSLFSSTKTVLGGTETITWNTKQTSKVSIGIHGNTKAFGLALAITGRVVAGLFKGDRTGESRILTPTPPGGCTKVPLGSNPCCESGSNSNSNF